MPRQHNVAVRSVADAAQQRIGVEQSYVTKDQDGTEIRTVFSFTDRTSPVPLAATLRLYTQGAVQTARPARATGLFAPPPQPLR